MSTSNPESTKLTPEKLSSLIANGESVVVLDVREPGEFEWCHIPESQNLPLTKLEKGNASLPEAEMIVLCCQSGVRAARARELLRSQLNSEIRVLDGGLRGWKKSGLPAAEKKGAPLPINRQVQIAAGSFIVAGILLGSLVNPRFYLLSAFVGCGLIFAGITGTCALASLLLKFPYNQPRS